VVIGEDILLTLNRFGQTEVYPRTVSETRKNKMTKTNQIEIELNETVAYSRASEKFECFCPGCKALVELATPQVAAIITRITEREIYRLVETNEVHFVETDRVLVCLKSLTQTLTDGNGSIRSDESDPLA